MKILSIRIKNIASLSGEHFINFEDEPLASTGLIAITGKTGAGKSTILDAICLALYSEIPRFKGITGNISDVSGQDLTLKDPKNILRRGCVDGFAELEFLGTDHKRYLAQWKVWRAHKKINGTLKYDRSITNVDEQRVLTTKTNDCTPLIEKLIGLSFDQFTRAVLLAQSEVTALLKAPDSKRSELLEYLTNSSIFAKVGQLAFEKTKEVANQRKELENVLGHISLLSEDEVQSLQLQFSQTESAIQQATLEKEQLEKQQIWFEQKQKYDSSIQAYQQQLTLQQQQLDTLAPKKLQLQQLERFASIHPYMIQNKSFNSDLLRLQPQLDKAQQEFDIIEPQYTAEKLSFEKLETEQKQQHQFEIQHQENIKLVRDRIAERIVLVDQLRKAQNDVKELEKQLIPHVNHEKNLKDQQEQLDKDLSQHKSQLINSAHFSPIDDALSIHISQVQRFIQSYEQFENNYGDVQHANQQLLEQQKQLEALINQFGQYDALHQKVTALRTKRDQLVQQLNQFNVVQQHWQNFQKIDAEYQTLINLNNTLSQKIIQTQTEFTTAESNYQEQKNTREQLQKILQQQRLLNTENIEKLRAELFDGEPCLVCGSTHHPYTNKTAFSDELFKLQEQQEHDAIETETLAFKTWQRLQTTLTEQKTALNANAEQLATFKAQLQQLQSELEKQLVAIHISFDFSKNHALLTQIIQTQKEQTHQTQQQVEDNLIQHENAQKNQHEFIQSIQHTTQHLSDVQQAESNLQQILNLLHDTEKHKWQQATLHTAKQIFACLQQRQQILKQLNNLKKQQDQTTQQLQQSTQQVKFSREKIRSAEKTIEGLTLDGKQNTDIAIQAIFAMTQITVEKPQDWLTEFDQNRQDLQNTFNNTRQSFDQIQKTFEITQSRLREHLAKQEQLNTQIKPVQEVIQAWLSKHTDFNIILIEQLNSISFEQEQKLKQDVSAVERTYADLQVSMKTVQEQLKQHLEYQPEIDLTQLNTQMTMLVEQISSLQKQHNELKIKLEIHQRNINQQHAFSEQIKLIQTEENRWSKISSLIGDAKGKDFRDYAQQYNLDILLEYANQQLTQLSQRYTLKRLDNSLSLAIIDHDMDGETRSVASLSGGESFLTALALSLAIANMASGTTKIESLFIDEGFGTLDASSLHMVMNALDQLQSQGRKVVLISHIAEMHERIPVQIQVNPLGAGASRIDIIG